MLTLTGDSRWLAGVQQQLVAVLAALAALTAPVIDGPCLAAAPLHAAAAGRLRALGLCLRPMPDLRFLRACSRLQYLELSRGRLARRGVWLSDANLQHLCGLPALRELSLPAKWRNVFGDNARLQSRTQRSGSGWQRHYRALPPRPAGRRSSW